MEGNKKHLPEGENITCSEEEYAMAFTQQQGRVVRTPPANEKPRSETKEERQEREIGETKELLNVEDENESDESSGESGSSDEESEREVKPEHEEVAEIGLKLNQMITSKTLDEVVALKLLNTLMEAPMSVEMFWSTRIVGTVGDLRDAFKNIEIRKLGSAVYDKWTRFINELAEANKKQEDDKMNIKAEQSMKRTNRESESGNEEPAHFKKQKSESSKNNREKKEKIENINAITMESSMTVEGPDATIAAMGVGDKNIQNNDIQAKASQSESMEEDLGTLLEQETYVYVKGDETDVTKLNSVKITDDFQTLLGRIPTINKSNTSLRILCINNREKQILMNTWSLAGQPVTFSEPYYRTANTSKRGIIFNVDEDLATDEIEARIGVPAKRIIKKVGGVTHTTKQVILYFDGNIPSHIYLGWRRFRVDIYIPEPIRCFNCQKYGHKSINCNSRQVCPVCSGKHSYNTCPVKNDYREKERARCPNCNGGHPASYKGCPKYQHAKQVEELKTKQGITYADAVKEIRKNEISKRIGLQTVGTVDHRHTNAIETITEQNNQCTPDNVNGNNILSNGNRTNELDQTEKHDECVDKLKLTKFVQAISILLLQSELTKQELINKLYQMLAELVNPCPSSGVK